MVEAGSRCAPPSSSPMVPYPDGGGPMIAAVGRQSRGRLDLGEGRLDPSMLQPLHLPWCWI